MVLLKIFFIQILNTWKCGLEDNFIFLSVFDIPLPIYLYLSFVTMFAYHLFKIVKKINMQLKIKHYGQQHEPRLCDGLITSEPFFSYIMVRISYFSS